MSKTHTEHVPVPRPYPQPPEPDHDDQAHGQPRLNAPARRRMAAPLEAACRLHDRALAWQAQGQYPRAAVAARRTLVLGERAVGPDHPDIASLLLTLASLAEAQGDYAATAHQAQRAVAIMAQVTGNDAITLHL